MHLRREWRTHSQGKKKRAHTIRDSLLAVGCKTYPANRQNIINKCRQMREQEKGGLLKNKKARADVHLWSILNSLETADRYT